MIQNTFWFRHFLICNRLANSVLNMLPQNFAKLIVDEDKGKIFNSQMTRIFWDIDKVIAELHGSDERMVFDCLEEEGVTIDDLAELSTEKLDDYFQQYFYDNFKI